MRFIKLFRYLWKTPVLSIKKHYYYRVDPVQCGLNCNNSLVLREVTVENYEEILLFRKDVVDTFRTFIDNKDIGLYGYINNLLISYAWCVLNKNNQMKIVRSFFKLPPNAAYVHYCRVSEQYQKQKVYQTMLFYIYKRAYEEVDEIYLDTEVDNISAQCAILKSGGMFQGSIIRFLIFGKDVFAYKISRK